MDLLSKDEPLINLNGFDSTEEGEDLLSEDYQPHQQRRLAASKHASLNNRQHRLPSGSKVYLRELLPKEQSMERQNSAIVAAVERTMKNYADGVLRVLEGMSGRLSQLESISQDLEHSVMTLKGSVEYNHEHTDRNFKILNERIMEMHRSLQILRDKQDIIEAHAQLAKLHTSKALAEKECVPGLMSTDSQEPVKQQEYAVQTVSQKPSSHPLVSQAQSFTSQPLVSQAQSFTSQPLVSQPPSVAAQSLVTSQFQSPNLQPQQLVPMQQVPQEASGQVMQQVSKVQTPSEQVHYKAVPLQLPTLQIMPPPQQPILQMQQPLEQGHYLPAPPQLQMQQPSTQQPIQVTTQQQTEPLQYQSAPQQRHMPLPLQQASVQQPIQAQQGMMPQQPTIPQQPIQAHQTLGPQQPPHLQQQQQQPGMIPQQPIQAHQQTIPQQPMQAHQTVGPQQPPHLQQQQPGSRLQGSVQYYGQPNDGQSYSSLTPGTPMYTQGVYVTEQARDSMNYASHQRPLAPSSTHQPSQLPPVQSFHQMALTPQITQSSHDPTAVGNMSGPIPWNRQANAAIPSAAPRFPTAQPVRAEHPPPEGSVVDKAVAMGFSRDQVQSVIRRLGERNQSVDMNVVLDILTNGGRGTQGGFGR